MEVASHDAEVRRLVGIICAQVEAAGGYIHPELVVNHQGSDLWLSLPRTANPFAGAALHRPHTEAPPLLVIPNELHIPVTDLDWLPSDSELAYRGSAPSLSETQRVILDAMVALFNAVDKVRLVGRAYPRHSLRGDPALAALILEARPQWSNLAHEEHVSPADTVVQSRLRSEMGEGDEGPLGFFMPMIDMLNHHPYGSRYERSGSGDWTIRVHHPTESEQVFVRYNSADALGIALGLGYFEPDTRFISSVACVVEVPPIGRIEVAGVAARKRRIPAPTVERTDTGLRIHGLVLEPGREDTLLTLLAMPMRSMLPKLDPAEVDALADRAMAEIVAANADYFTRLGKLCASSGDAVVPVALLPQEPTRKLCGRVATSQQRILAALRSGTRGLSRW